MTKAGYYASTTINCSPRKVRLVIGLVRNKTITEALQTLMFTNKKSAKAVAKVIKSACANGALTPSSYGEVRVTDIRADEFSKLKRTMPRGKGSAAPFWRRWTKINVSVS